MSQRAEENSVFASLSEFKQKNPKVIDYSKHSPVFLYKAFRGSSI